MPAQVFIEFLPDFSKLESATDQLAAEGKISKSFADDFKKAGQASATAADALRKSGAKMAGSLDQLSRNVKGLSKDMVTSFGNSVTNSMEKVTATMHEMATEAKVVEAAQKSLKRELKELTAAIAEATLEGTNSGPAYQSMVARAGEIKDAMGDAAAQVNVFASDTGRLDKVIGIMTGVTAAFSIAQGATALFGAESEELQEAQTKLMGSMAILQGLQEISNLTQEQTAAFRAAQKIQTLAAAAATNLETAATSKNIIVKNLAIGTTKILNFVMRQNPAFLLVSIFVALGGALAYFANKSKDAAVNSEELNTALDRQNEIMNRNIGNVQHQTKLLIAGLRERGATEKEIHEAVINGLQREAVEAETTAAQLAGAWNLSINGQKLYLNNLQEAAKSQRVIQDKLNTATDEDNKKSLQNQLSIANKVVEAYTIAGGKRREVDESVADFSASQAEKARQAAKEANDKRQKDAKEAADRARALEEQRLADIKASIERQLLTAEDGSQRQLDLRLKLAAAEKDISAFAAKSNAERQLVYAQYLKNIGDLTTTFHKEQKAKALQAQADTLSAQLASDRLSAQEREVLSVELLNRQRDIELSQVENNAAKIKEINARFDRDISAQRLQIRQAAFDAELLLEQTQGAARKRALEEVANSDKAAVNARLAAVQDLTIADIQSVNKQLENARRLHDERLMSDTDYNQKYAELQDQLSQIAETAEKRRTEINKAEVDKQKEKDRERVLALLDASNQVMGSLAGIDQAMRERQLQQFEAQRAQLEQQKEAGAITEKEYAARLKRMEREELAVKRRQATRDKLYSLFSAAVQGGAAIINAAASVPFSLLKVAAASAVVGAQLLAIGLKKPPAFAKGTRRAPKGWAIVGEAGPELIEGKGWQYADSPSLTYFKGGERVYNARETREIFERRTPMADTAITRGKTPRQSLKIDYGKLSKSIGDEIAKHPRLNVNVNERGLGVFIEEQNSKTHYLNKRYTFGK